jgi:hypothetical protein
VSGTFPVFPRQEIGTKTQFSLLTHLSWCVVHSTLMSSPTSLSLFFFFFFKTGSGCVA